MFPPQPCSEPSTFNSLLFRCALLLVAVVAVTLSFVADLSAQSISEDKQIEADIQLALERLDENADRIKTPKALDSAAQGFAPVDVYAVPDDWTAAGLDISKAKEVDGHLVQTLPNGSKVVLTINPKLQHQLDSMFRSYNVPHGAVVLIDPGSGRVLALSSYTRKDPYLPNLAIKASSPSASVFKIITAAALVQDKKVDLKKNVCYHGGLSHLDKANIVGNKRLDRRCDRDLADALAFSTNSIVAKLAYQNLKKENLEDWAERFGYNQQIPFELPVEISKAEFPDDPIELARSAAGFWHTYLSPLHAAMIGAALANHGVMMQPAMIEKYYAPNGKLLYQFSPKIFKQAMSRETADKLAEALIATTHSGTARNFFRFRNEFPSSRITVSGKTGTLSRKSPSYLGYTWFVGYGKDEETHKRVAVSGLVCNTPIWRIKGGYAASEGIRLFFDQ